MGVSRIFFGYTWHARGVLFSPVQNDEPRYKILRTSQCSLHAPIFEGQADKIRRDGRAPESANAEGIRRRSTDVRHRAPRAKIKGAHRQGWGLGNVLLSVLAMVNRQMTEFG